jgi:predicted permease
MTGPSTPPGSDVPPPDWPALVRSRLPRLPAAIADEIAQHLADLHAESLRAGASPDEASRAAARALDDDGPFAEEVRLAEVAPARRGSTGWQAGQQGMQSRWRGGVMVGNVRKDFGYAIRLLRRQPSFALFAIVTLALGIGVNVAVFSVMRAALLASLPVPDPDRLVSIVTWTPQGGDHADFSYPLYVDMREAGAPAASVAAYSIDTVGIANGDRRERLLAEFITANYFDVLGIRVRLGRGLTGDDERPGAPPVAIVSEAVWRSMFAADPAVSGREIALDGQPVTIIGVAPPGFSGFVRGQRADLWMTVSQEFRLRHQEGRLDKRTTSWLSLVGRLKPGATPDQLQAMLKPTLQPPFSDAAELVRTHPARAGNTGLVEPLERPLKLLLLVVGLILVTAIANIANLMLARSWSRRQELAIRQSLGASRTRLAQQLLVEAGVLSALGGAGALAAGTWIARVLEVRTSSGASALALSVRPDAIIIGLTILLAVVATLAIGIVPAFAVPSVTQAQALRSGEGHRVARRRRALRTGLTVVQIALSLVLVVGAGLFLRSLGNLRSVDPSLQTDRTVAASLNIALRGLDEPRAQRFYGDVLDAVRRQPGVESAALAYVLPVTPGGMRMNLRARATVPVVDTPVEFEMVPVSSGFFASVGVPLVLGRDFSSADRADSPKALIVNEQMSRKFWPDGNAVGQTFTVDPDRYTVVGVAKDSKYRSFRETPRMTMYVPLSQSYMPAMNLVVRTSQPPTATIPLVRRAIQQVDALMPVYNVRTLDEHVNRSLYLDRLRARLLLWLSALALAIAAIGVYGVVSFDVVQRRRELGIRLALGAQKGRILGMLLGSSVRLAALGIVAGALLAVWLARSVAAQLYDVAPWDPAALAGAAAVLFAATLTATYLPARRAMAINPLESVREE